MNMTWHHLLSGMLFCAASEIACGDDRPLLPPEIQRTLAWLPEDTETLIAAQSFLIPSEKERDEAMAISDSLDLDLKNMIQIMVFDGLLGMDGDQLLESLAGRKVTLALNGARNFDLVSKFGSTRSESCGIVIFEKALEAAWLEKLKAKSKEVRRIKQRDILVFPSTTVKDSVIAKVPWEGRFIVLLQPNTLLFATSDRFLETVLSRVDTKAATRALPDHLPEWKHLDPRAPYWMLRHIPGDESNATGLTLSEKKDGFQVVYLPRATREESTLNYVWNWWNQNPQGAHPKIRKAKDGTTVVWSNDFEPYIMQLGLLEGDDGLHGIPKILMNDAE